MRKFLLHIIPYDFIRFVRKHFTINYLFWGSSKKNVGFYRLNINKSENEKFSFGGKYSLKNETILEAFINCGNQYKKRSGLLREYILECNDCIIEPRYGWGIANKDNTLIFDSLSNNSWKEQYHPPFLPFWWAKTINKTGLCFDQAVSIRMIEGGHKNYWHFFNDLIGQVVLAQENNLDHLPFIISYSFSKQKFFIEALELSSYLKSRVWIVQDDNSYIECKKVFFLQKEINHISQFNKVIDFFNSKEYKVVSKKKIFLTRNSTRIRSIKNIIEVEQMMLHHGFEIIDTDTLSIKDQIILFKNTAVLVGIHGAGLVNMIFRANLPLKILEIFPKNYIQPHYFWLATDFNYEYDAFIGGQLVLNSQFEVNLSEFEYKIQLLIK